MSAGVRLLGGLVEVLPVPAPAAKETREPQRLDALWHTRRENIDRQFTLATERDPVQPEILRFYRTGADSLVFVCSIDADGDARAHMLHDSGNGPTRFLRPGASSWIYRDGHASRNEFVSFLSGDWLKELLPWRVDTACIPDVHGGPGNWLTLRYERTNAAVKIERAGLWRTCNGSLVVVSPKSGGSWGATVTQGGVDAEGAKSGSSFLPGSDYTVSHAGAVVVYQDSEHLENFSKLAMLSGSALEAPVHILDEGGVQVILKKPEPVGGTSSAG